MLSFRWSQDTQMEGTCSQLDNREWGQGQRWGWTTNSSPLALLLLQALFPHQSSWDFRKTLLQSLLRHTQETSIFFYCLAHQAQKTRTRAASVMWFHRMPWVDASSRPRQKPLLLSRAPSRCLRTLHLLCSSPLLPGMASLLPVQDAVYCSSPEWSPFWPGQPTLGAGSTAESVFNSSATGHVHQVLFPVRSSACTWQGGTSIRVNCSVPAEFVRMRHNSLSKGGCNRLWCMDVSKQNDEVHSLLPGAPNLVNIPKFVWCGSGMQRAHQQAQMHTTPFSSVLDGPHTRGMETTRVRKVGCSEISWVTPTV